MDKKIIIGIIIAVVVVIVLIFAFSGKKEPPKGQGINVVNTTEEQIGGRTAGGSADGNEVDANAVDIQTSDDVFNQLDDAVNYAD